MICHDLQQIGIHNEALIAGSRMHDMERCPDGSTMQELDAFHRGKEDSIDHMLAGGNGFAPTSFQSHVMRSVHDTGCTIERRDLRSLTVWASAWRTGSMGESHDRLAPLFHFALAANRYRDCHSCNCRKVKESQDG
jgi:hypothetical protein